MNERTEHVLEGGGGLKTGVPQENICERKRNHTQILRVTKNPLKHYTPNADVPKWEHIDFYGNNSLEIIIGNILLS